MPALKPVVVVGGAPKSHLSEVSVGARFGVQKGLAHWMWWVGGFFGVRFGVRGCAGVFGMWGLTWWFGCVGLVCITVHLAAGRQGFPQCAVHPPL